MKTKNQVVVPDHIAKEIEEQNKETGEALDETYVPEEKRVLDPTLLDQSLIDRMPQPQGYRILVLPYAGTGVSSGGIHLVKSHIERETLASVCAYVVKMVNGCYNDSKKFGDTPWCQEKQWVLIGRYAGARFKLGDDAECRLINDDEVFATIKDPNDIIAV